MRATSLASLLILLGLTAACQQREAEPAKDASPPVQQPAPGADQEAKRNEQIMAAVQGGDYAQAIQLARAASVPKPEADFAVGELILQGLSDAQAAQPPTDSLTTGLSLMEASAQAGHEPAIFGLAALFYTGLRAGSSDTYLIAADEALSKCWEQAKESRDQVPKCVAMRAQR